MTRETTMTDPELNRALAKALGVGLSRTLSREEFVCIISEFVGFPWDGERWVPALYANGPEDRVDLPEARNDTAYTGSFDWVAGWIYDNRVLLSDEAKAIVDRYTVGLECDPPDYCGSLEEAFKLGEEMRKRGLIVEYLNRLAWMMMDEDPRMMNDEIRDRVAHASARERAEAAWSVLEGRERDVHS